MSTLGAHTHSSTSTAVRAEQPGQGTFLAEPSPGVADTGRWRLPVELPVAIVTACVVSLGAQWLVAGLDISMPSFAPLGLLALSGLVLLGGAVLLVSRRRWGRWATPLSWVGLAALGTLPLALLLQNTPFYLHGVSQDQLFRVQYMQRLTESMALADGNYANLPPFYPAGWFWVGGRFANLLDMPAWAAYKPYAILTMAVAAVVAFVLWSRIVRRPVALLAAVLTCLVGLRVAAYEPYSWILAAAMPPVAIIAWRAFANTAAGGRRGVRPLVLVGLFLGVCGAVYTLHFGFFSMTLVVLAAAAVAARCWRDRAERGALAAREVLRVAGRAVGDLATAALVALPVMLLVWTPFLLEVIERGTLPSSAAPKYLPKNGATLPTPMFDFSVTGAICLLGTVWIVLAWRRSGIARALGLLAACCYGWYALSLLALGMRTTLLAFRVEPVLHAALFCAGGIAGLELVRWLAARTTLPRHAPPGAVFAVVTVLALVSLVQTVGSPDGDMDGDSKYEIAYTTYKPNGENPLGGADSDDKDNQHGQQDDGQQQDSEPAPGSYNDELLHALDEMTTGQPSEHVMLTTYYDILAYRPYWGFQLNTVHYANPLAHFQHRRALVESWASANSSAQLLARLKASPYAAPDVFVLRDESDGLHMRLSKGVFPRVHNVASYDVVFEESLFDGPHFQRRDIGPFTVIVRSGGGA